ncbi:MAG: hypothetical protein R3293_13065 [Candidatus Promineifilaceae bacterium]|nr:hypothetical protein [Candidatus Promineifilaceae bacterium]
MGYKRILQLLIIGFFAALACAVLPVKGAELSAAQKIITVEIHYFAPEAGRVDFVWGIDGWQLVADELMNEGSSVIEGQIVTPMQPAGESFYAQIRVPAGSSVQYSFRIMKTANGDEVDIWDQGKDPLRDYSPMQPILIASYDKVFEVDAAFSLDQTLTANNENPASSAAYNNGVENDAVPENDSASTIFSRHWPLLVAGLLILLGIIIGFRRPMV